LDEHTLQSLGKKTGKHEFFEARKHNMNTMRTMLADEASRLLAPDHSTAQAASYMEIQRQRAVQDAASRLCEKQRIALGEPLPDDVILQSTNVNELVEASTSMCADSTVLPFLHDPAQYTPPQPSLSPEFDMTSSAKFNESKAMLAATNRTASIFSGRSGLRIDDIIDSSTADSVPSHLKRKAVDISDAIEDEVRNWESDLTARSSMTTVASDQSICQTPGKQGQTGLITTSLDPAYPIRRPTKRVKKIVERLGYAAIGGAAVGATLFSILVATAPEFM